jgi:hypothetical protein
MEKNPNGIFPAVADMVRAAFEFKCLQPGLIPGITQGKKCLKSER